MKLKELSIVPCLLFLIWLNLVGAARAGEIYDAAQLGDAKKVEALLNANPDLVNAKDQNSGGTPLFFAAGYSHKDIVELLLSKGADVNVKDNLGRTLLFNSNKDIAELLLSKGADINVKDNLGQTLLFPVALTGNKERVKFFLDQGLDVNARDSSGQTPLFNAAYNGNKDAAELLLSHGADVNVKDNDGKTPLQVAVEKGKTDIADLLRKFSDKASGNDWDEALAAARQQQWAVAIRDFLKVQTAKPTDPAVLYNLGLAESKVPGRELRAMAWLQAYLLAAPDATNATAVRTEITGLKVRVESALDKLVAQAIQMAGQSPEGNAIKQAFCKVAIAQARTGDGDGAVQTRRKAGIDRQALCDEVDGPDNHYNNSYEYKSHNPLPTTAKDRLDELLKLVNNDMSDELFTNPQGAMQTITTNAKSIGPDAPYAVQVFILSNTVLEIERLADTLNDLKNLSP